MKGSSPPHLSLWFKSCVNCLLHEIRTLERHRRAESAESSDDSWSEDGATTSDPSSLFENSSNFSSAAADPPVSDYSAAVLPVIREAKVLEEVNTYYGDLHLGMKKTLNVPLTIHEGAAQGQAPFVRNLRRLHFHETSDHQYAEDPHHYIDYSDDGYS